eukprot:1149146-Pelagomonas_calceolata.AAC.2
MMASHKMLLALGDMNTSSVLLDCGHVGRSAHALGSKADPDDSSLQTKFLALGSIADPDVSYLRRVLVDAFTSGALPRSSPIFPVIARLLK